MELHGRSLIGDALGDAAGTTFHAKSPLDGRSLEPAFHNSGPADVDRAMELAEAAFDVYRATSGEVRATFLERIADEIVAIGDPLIARAAEETGLAVARLTGERARTAAQLRMFAGLARSHAWVDARIDTAMPERQPAAKPDIRRVLAPIGPVVVFGSSNFPLAFSVAGGDTASALASGNPVVVKAHSAHPGTSELVARAVGRAAAACGLPAGVFSLLHGPGSVIGMALVRHPYTRAAGFTGSRTAGRALFDAAAARPEPIPVFAEMSSLNPLFILPEAMEQRATQIAEGLRGSLTLGVGQFCTKPGLIFGLEGASFSAFGAAFARAIEDVAPGTMLHEGIRDAYRSGLDRVLALRGVAVAARSTAPADPHRTHAEAVVARTDVATFRAHPELAEEVFGPFGLLIAARTMRELEETAAGLEGQLTATLHGTEGDLAKAARLVRILERKAGRLIVNGFPTGVEVCPAMHHGGPYPATTDVRFTSVGTAAIYRFVRPVCYQDMPSALLPDTLKDDNPLRIWRTVNGTLSPPT